MVLFLRNEMDDFAFTHSLSKMISNCLNGSLSVVYIVSLVFCCGLLIREVTT
jgi:hypothetical protein